MPKGMRVFAFLILVSITLAIRPAIGACLPTTLVSLLANANIAGIFRGQVITLRTVQYPLPDNLGLAQGQVAVVRVELVWKGSISRETVVHFRLGEGNRGLADEGDYLFITHELSEFGRQQFGLSSGGEPGLGANELGCGVIPFESPYATQLLGRAPGQLPR